MDASIYHILKEKGAVSFKKNEDGTFEYTVKQFDSLTGEKLDDIVNGLSIEMVDEQVENTNNNIKTLNLVMSNLIMLKEDLQEVK